MKYIHCLIVLSLIASSEVAAGQLSSEDKTVLIQELISSSGLDDRIRGLPPLINRMMVRGIVAAGDPNEISRPLSQIVTSTFRASSIKNKLARELAKNLTVAELKNTAAFFESSLGREIVNLEREASLDGKYSIMANKSDQLQETNRKDPARARLFEKLDSATYGSVIAVNLAQSMRLGVGNSLLSASLRFDEVSRSGLQQRVDAAHFRLRGRITQQIFLTYLFLFEKTKDNDLVTYLEFAESNSGKKYFLSVKEGINLALTDAFKTTDKLLAESLKPHSSS